jgi:hypothetical protein
MLLAPQVMALVPRKGGKAKGSSGMVGIAHINTDALPPPPRQRGRPTLKIPQLSNSTSGHARHQDYATSRKVAGSIPDEIIGFFNCPNPSRRTMALGSTQPLTEMSTRNLPWG